MAATAEEQEGNGNKRLQHRLFRNTLLQLGLGLAAITLAGTAIAYFYVLSSMEGRTRAELKAYIRTRGAQEEALFALAEDNQAVLKAAILRRLAQTDAPAPDEAFNRLFVRFPDGITRNRPEHFDGTRMAAVCSIDPHVPMTTERKRRILIFNDLVNQYGPAWHNRFQDTYITTPDNIMVMYWPEVPHWCRDTTATFRLSIKEYVWVADARHDPARKTVWTGLLYDHISGNWLVTSSTPVYFHNLQVATIHHDILLNELLNRARDDRLEGTYNIILRRDGRLIAHPKLVDALEKAGGQYDIPTRGSAHLKAIYAAVRSHPEKSFVIRHPDADEYLAVTHLQGVDWYFITVFPRSILSDLAFGTARMVLLLGFLALLLQAMVLFWIVRRQVDAPLARLMAATQRVEAGDYHTRLRIQRQDEFGQLAHAFNRMTARVRNRDQKLAETAQELDLRVQQRTAELETARQSAERSAQDAERATRSKSAFLANMSHEIRTPMNAILGFTELLDSLISNRQQRDYLKSIQVSGKTLLALINDILDLSKVEAGKLELTYAPAAPRALLNEVAQMFSRELAAKGLEFRLDLSPDLPPALMLDEARLRQVLINLVGNAVKFTDRGHIRLSAQCSPAKPADNAVDLILAVEDTGIGIPAEQQDRIFGAFEQQHDQSVSRYGGTGLGLAITRRLVELMGGTIRLESQVGQGSRFQVCLPQLKIAAETGPETSAPPQPDPDAIVFTAFRLLVADDIAANRDLVRGYLAGQAVELIEAGNGQDALDLVLDRQPDIVLMDMRMPGLSGYDATRRLKSDPRTRDIPVIALTASAMSQNAHKITALCDGYLRKPVSRANLIAELARFLPHRHTATAPEPAPGPATEAMPQAEWPAGELDARTREALGQLLDALKSRRAACDKLIKTLSINDIEAFARQMQSLGSQHAYPPLIHWGARLAEQTEQFDLNGITATLSGFADQIAALEALLA